MKKLTSILLGLLLTTAAAVLPVSSVRAEKPASKHTNAAIGAGHYLVSDTLDVQYAFVAIQQKNGKVEGSFHETTNDGMGTVDFHAKVTCLAVDSELGRAWIGGVITENKSTSPDYTAANMQPGHDIWFRVLDSDDEGVGDRSTFMGFEGAIPDSATYCATRPWADNNARTWPVTKGHIFVR